MTQNSTVFDAIVVGSGISGGWAAKELCEQGLRVLLLERGKMLEHPDYPTATLNPWESPHRGGLTREDRKKYHIQTRHYSIHEENKRYYVNDLENPYVENKRYDWIRADVLGGRSLVWGRQCYRWSDMDFEANLREGIATDWPIRYRDIAPWYDYVERFVGVSGARENIPHLPDGEFLPPMPYNCVEKDFKEKVEARFPGRRLIMGRAANLTAAIGGRGPCQFRNRCDRGCPYGAYFSTNSGTLPAAQATKRLTVVSDALVNRVVYDDARGRARAVEAVDVRTGRITEYSGRLIFLNASTLGTAFILLNSTSARFPDGLGNGSGQVGRNLMDHHKGSGAISEVHDFGDRYFYGRRPNQIYMPRFRNIGEKSQDFIRGYGMQGGAGRRGWNGAGRSAGIGNALKAAAVEPGPWTFTLYGYGECLPYPDNRVSLSKEKTDKWGRPALAINCAFRENERAMNRDMAPSAAEMLEAAGYSNVRPFSEMSYPGNANHEMGTARMGRDPKTSVLNAFNQMHEAPNVFITDGSCMVSSSCVNPSLTYMALTARACHYAVSEMKKLNL